MEPIPSVLAATLKKLLLSILAELRRFFGWVVAFCKKLFWPRRDARSGIVQSRMRYYRIQFTLDESSLTLAYQEVDSNGNVTRYLTSSERPFLPPKGSQPVLVDKEFQRPPWRSRIDWRDLLNGDIKSGCFGISEPM